MKQTPGPTIPPAQMMLIAGALHFSILIYIFVIFLLAKSSEGWVMGWFLKEGGNVFLFVFGAAALMAGTFSLLVPRIMKGGSSEMPSTPHEVLEKPLFFDFSSITPRIQTLTILRMALAESVAIFGFVLSMLNQSSHWILPFAAAGLLLQILVGPFGRFLRGN